MSPWAAVAWVWLASALAMALAWQVQRRTRNATTVDAVWAGSLALAALFYGAVATGDGRVRVLVAVLGALWGFRLCLHVLARALHEAEDGRYAHLRRHWRDDQRKFFAFYQGQALLVALFSLAFVAPAWNPAPAAWPWLAAAAALWLLALAGEAIADRRSPAGAAGPSIAVAPCAAACGGTRDTPTTFSNGCTGSPTCRWRSARRCSRWPCWPRC